VEQVSFRRPQISLRGLFWLVVMFGATFGLFRWLGSDTRAATITFLAMVVPACIAMERACTPQAARGVRPTARSAVIAAALIIAASALPAAIGVAVLSLEIVFPLIWLVAMSLFDLNEIWAIVAIGMSATVVTSAFLATRRWPGPIPLRAPILLATFALLCLVYCAIDATSAISEAGWGKSLTLWAGNFVAVLLLAIFWWRHRNRATRFQALALMTVFNCWLVGLAFPVMGGLMVDDFFQFDLSGIFQGGPAPRVDREDWSKLRKGMSRAEVERLLGSRGNVATLGAIQHADGTTSAEFEVWQYEWYGPGFFFRPDDRSYVVWFDATDTVSRFRPPLYEQEPDDLALTVETVATLSTSMLAPADGTFRAVAMRLPWVYVLERSGHLWVFRVDPADVDLGPNLERRIELAGDGHDIQIVGDTLLLTSHGKLVTYSLQRPDEPRLLGRFGRDEPRVRVSSAIVHAESRIYLLCDGAVDSFDCSIPSHPRLLGSMQTDATNWTGCASGARLYVGETPNDNSDRAGIAIYDATHPEKLIRSGFVPLEDSPYHLFTPTENRLLVLVDRWRTADALLIDVSDSKSPAIIKTFDRAGGRGAAMVRHQGEQYLITNGGVFRIAGDRLKRCGDFEPNISTLDGSPYRGAGEGNYAAIVGNNQCVLLRLEAEAAP
jgi:hypothetical protein